MRSSDWSSDVCSSDLADVRDPHYRAAVLAAYGRTVAGRRPSASFVQRRIAGGGMRTFHRLLIPLVTPGGVPEILSVPLPQVHETARYLLPDRLRISPDQGGREALRAPGKSVMRQSQEPAVTDDPEGQDRSPGLRK